MVKDDSSPSLKMVGSGANAASAAFLPSRQRAWRSASVMALLPFGLRPRFIFVTPPMRISRMWERTTPGGPMSSQQIFGPYPRPNSVRDCSTGYPIGPLRLTTQPIARTNP